MSDPVVFVKNLGTDFELNVGEQKIKVNIDGLTIVRDPVTNKLKVDSSALAIGPSTDAGNLLTAGSDGRVFIDAEAVQDAVGAAIVNAVPGLEYDDVMNAIKVHFANMAVADTDSVDLTLDSTDPAAPAIKADLKVDPVAGNLLKVTATGTAVNTADVVAAVASLTSGTYAVDSATDPANPVGVTTITMGTATITITQNLDEVKDAFGVGQGVYFVKP